MTCFNCGKEVKDLSSKFCSNCGAPIEEPDEELDQKEANKPESKRQKVILLICAVAIVLAVIAVVITGINTVSQKKAAAEIEEKVIQEKKEAEEEEAAKKKVEDEAKAKVEADEAAKKAAEEEAKKKAEADAKAAADAAADAQAARTWTDEKTLKLRGFMSSWGQTMGQQYQEYWPGKSVNFYGVRVPDDITGVRPQGMIVAVGGAPVVVQWSQSGEEQGVYHLVAVYSDMDSGEIKPGGGHCYLFCIYNGQPVALHTSQNQGNPENYFHFAPTENADLSRGFADILQGRR